MTTTYTQRHVGQHSALIIRRRRDQTKVIARLRYSQTARAWTLIDQIPGTYRFYAGVRSARSHIARVDTFN